MSWDILVTIQNIGGNGGIDNILKAPIDVYVDFDPNRPYGYDPVTGKPHKLADYPELLYDIPEQQWMSVPRADLFGGSSFILRYPDGGPGSPYQRVPTRFDIFLDQFRGNSPPRGLVAESNEFNNAGGVLITDYDTINGYTGNLLRSCWYME